MINVPQKIYLQVGDEELEENEDFTKLEVTWCSDKIFPYDIEYVLAEKANETTHDVSKKYSKEDLEKAMSDYGKWITGAWPFFGFVSTTEEAKEKIIQSIAPIETHDVSNVDSEEFLKLVDDIQGIIYKFTDMDDDTTWLPSDKIYDAALAIAEWQQSQINKNK